MDQHADYLLLRQLVFAQPRGVRGAGADARGAGVRGGGGAGLLLEG